MTDTEQALRALLSEPSASAYPYSRGEDRASWLDQATRALDVVAKRGMLGSGDGNGSSVGRAFEELLSGPIADFLLQGVGRARLTGSLLRNIADPGRINQGFKGTCAVTCVESYLAERLPAEYCRIIVGLAQPLGQVQLRNEESLFRDEQQLIWSEREAFRGPVSRLFQVSAMEHAYPELDYRNTWDGYVDPDRASIPAPGERLTRPSSLQPTGLDLDAFDRFLEGVTGERWDTLSQSAARIAAYLEKLGLPAASAPRLERDGLGVVIRSAQAGEPTFVTLDVRGQPAIALFGADVGELPHMLHKVRVLEIDLEAGRVVYEDPLDPAEPWLPGVRTRVEDLQGRCSMALDDFEGLMVEISFKPRFWSPEHLDAGR